MTADGAPADTAVVTLTLNIGTETISGTLRNERGGERPFWGWLELSEALDRTRGIDARNASGRPLDQGV